MTRDDVRADMVLPRGAAVRLVGMRVKPSVSAACDGPLSLPVSVWMAPELGGRNVIFRYALSAARSFVLRPVAFGHFTNARQTDGRFAQSGYDVDGYVLMWDGFARKSLAWWGYH